MLLIDSLPDELDHLCITLIHENDKLPFEEVHSALLNYEIQKKDRKEHQESVEAKGLIVIIWVRILKVISGSLAVGCEVLFNGDTGYEIQEREDTHGMLGEGGMPL